MEDISKCPRCNTINWLKGLNIVHECWKCGVPFKVQVQDPRDKFNPYEELIPFLVPILVFILGKSYFQLGWLSIVIITWVVFLALIGILYFIWLPMLVKFNLFLKTPREEISKTPQSSKNINDPKTSSHPIGEPFYPILYPSHKLLIILAIIAIAFITLFYFLKYLTSKTIINFQNLITTLMIFITSFIFVIFIYTFFNKNSFFWRILLRRRSKKLPVIEE